MEGNKSISFEQEFPEKPNYLHYLRVKRILGDEAVCLLAHFGLLKEEPIDPSQYSMLFQREKDNARKIFADAFKDDFQFRDLGEARILCDYTNEFVYQFNRMEILVADILTLAQKLRYKLPDVLIDLITYETPDVQEVNEVKAVKVVEEKDKTALPMKLDSIADDEGGNNAELGIEPQDDKENTKVIAGLLKMVIAMARDVYGFDPEDKKSTTTADIMKALDKCGLSLSENTIRTRLKEAVELLPRKDKAQ